MTARKPRPVPEVPPPAEVANTAEEVRAYWRDMDRARDDMDDRRAEAYDA